MDHSSVIGGDWLWSPRPNGLYSDHGNKLGDRVVRWEFLTLVHGADMVRTLRRFICGFYTM